MATLVLSAAGGYAGGVFGGNLGAILGSRIDQAIGILPSGKRNIQGSRLSNLQVQTSTYGEMIPAVYGSVRVAGNIIWARPIKETASTSSSGGKGASGGSVSQTNYSYSATLAIAICAGEIDEVIRVWADSKVIDPTAFSGGYTLYKGSETQLPDALMESFEGSGKVPAYRGLAYVVIEDFPLADYGNRIPNFTFEVKRKMLSSDSTLGAVEELVTSVIMIPGSGEFVYDTVVQSKVTGETVGGNFAQTGIRNRINQNNRDTKADALVAVDQMLATLPNLEWVGLVVTWFGDTLDAATCTLKPKVEYTSGATTLPDIWQVGSVTRATAAQITLDVDGNPIYGGTPSDHTITRMIAHLKSKGLKVMLYPMFFMDMADKPWRGRVTGSTTSVANFFTKTNGYNAFITHYANMAASTGADAFVIGSELIGLTKVKTVGNTFPAVDALVSLAATVKTIVGSGCKVTYAADWSEYHHTDGGWYNMDPLWASANIDVVGIDAYFPLTDSAQQSYDVATIKAGWTSGEGYSWYYTDPARTTQASLSAPYAWKNISWWWNNYHTNPDSTTSAWVPGSKPIWLTEYGFPSVDGASNQPNVFYDPHSSEGALPRFSKGRVDFRIQRACIAATEEQWHASSMIPNKFVWTWDARPYPFWPDLTNVWTDGPLWKYGHWINGKFGLSGLGGIVRDICLKAGLTTNDIDTSRLNDLVDGFTIPNQTTARRAIEELQKAFFFDAVESDGKIKFMPRGATSIKTIPEVDLLPQEKDGGSRQEILSITRQQELELPRKIDVTYINPAFDYQVGNQHAERLTTQSQETQSMQMSIVMPDQLAKNVAEIALYNSWLERTRYDFSVPSAYATLEPTDIVTITTSAANHVVRITKADMGADMTVRVKAVAEDVEVYNTYAVPSNGQGSTQGVVAVISPTHLEILDIPALPTDGDTAQGALRFAALGSETNWRGAVIYRADSEAGEYAQQAVISNTAVVGTASTVLAAGVTTVLDEINSVTVLLSGLDAELNSISLLEMLNGGNLALLGSEVIQFTTATLVAPYKYTLSGLLRGRLGTEHQVGSHVAGERFVLLDARINSLAMPNALVGLARYYKGVSVGSTLGATASNSFTYSANALKPFSPVQVTGVRDGSGNLTISWIRRARMNGGWRDNVDIPLDEAQEAYEIEVLNGGTVVRTLTGLSSATASYSAANQTTDFGSPQASISVRVYQLSAIVGRGTAATATV